MLGGAQPERWLASITDLSNAAPADLAMQATAPQPPGAVVNDAIQQLVPSAGAFEAGAASDTASPAVGAELNTAMSELARICCTRFEIGSELVLPDVSTGCYGSVKKCARCS